MSRCGAMPKTSPTGWVYISSGNITVRWQRGDSVAYIFDGKQLKTYPDEAPRVKVLDTVPVVRKGWTDLTHVRMLGEAWLKANHKRCSMCGRVA